MASLRELRDVAHGIYPAVVSDHGLAVALESLAARSAVPVDLDVDVSDRPPEAVAVAAYYVVAEALANVGKHAAASRVRLRVWKSGQMLAVDVSDNGIGTTGTLSGQGLRGLADRVDALGGFLHVGPAAGGGVCVHAEIPCPP